MENQTIILKRMEQKILLMILKEMKMGRLEKWKKNNKNYFNLFNRQIKTYINREKSLNNYIYLLYIYYI